jgi:hypothetical protein
VKHRIAHDSNRVPDAVQRLFGGAPQSRDPNEIAQGIAPDQQRTTPHCGALRSIRGT